MADANQRGGLGHPPPLNDGAIASERWVRSWLIEMTDDHDIYAVARLMLAYGGAPIGALVEAHPNVRPRSFASVLGRLAEPVLWPAEPLGPSVASRGALSRAGGMGWPVDTRAPAAARLRALAPSPGGSSHSTAVTWGSTLLKTVCLGEGAVNPLPAVPESQASGRPVSKVFPTQSDSSGPLTCCQPAVAGRQRKPEGVGDRECVISRPSRALEKQNVVARASACGR
jgi:hypothetical protein